MTITPLYDTIVRNADETTAWVESFAPRLVAGDVLAFYGTLGTGKTFICQRLGEWFGSAEPPSSPTFTILNQYTARDGMPLYHFDFYRIEHPGELVNLGLDDFFYGEGICLIEWAEKVEDLLPTPRYEIRLELIPDRPDARRIRVWRL